MSTLPRLRQDLDFMPSPLEEQPGLLIRDSFHYSDAVLVVPPSLVPALACFDGRQTERDLRATLVKLTGDRDPSSLSQHLQKVLGESGFLEDRNYEQLRSKREREFADSACRMPAHAGSAYPDEPAELQSLMSRYLARDAEPRLASVPVGIAAPHVSPEGGWQCYQAAYAALPGEARDRTFVVLGTSHYGEPDRFGLTAKPFSTPFGVTRTDPALLEQLQAQPAAKIEDYCHAVEHSIEFQVIFLQSLFGPDICILPILVGSFGRSFTGNRVPEAEEGVARFLDALGEMHARNSKRLLWVLGVDMAHMGRRYGDEISAVANLDGMQGVARRDAARMERLNAGDPRGFWDLIRENGDDLKWCGSSPLYTFLKAVPEARGTIRRYEQWNIDPQSVVSFAGITFEG